MKAPLCSCVSFRDLTASSIPIFLAHRQNFALLKALPPNSVDWSILCPSTMTPESSEMTVPMISSHARLTANAMMPPLWKDSSVKYIPFLGKILSCAMNASRYEATLEQSADFIASDLESYESPWSGKTVGIIDGSK